VRVKNGEPLRTRLVRLYELKFRRRGAELLDGGFDRTADCGFAILEAAFEGCIDLVARDADFAKGTRCQGANVRLLIRKQINQRRNSP
jgi:hypothetical protein